MPSHPDRVRKNYETPGRQYKRYPVNLLSGTVLVDPTLPGDVLYGMVVGRFENGDLYVLTSGTWSAEEEDFKKYQGCLVSRKK